MRRVLAALLGAGALLACPPPGGGDGGVDAGPDPAIITPNAQGFWRDDVGYQVFVRSFFDSDGDGIGDLRGLTQQLDALNDADADAGTPQDLGIDLIWTMPIHPSPSYHGYDVTDYRAVHPDYGTLADFDAYVAAAHARGIKVVIDLVVNHTSSQHPWFQSARQGPSSPYRDFYVWQDTKPAGWQRPWEAAEVWHEANGDYYYGVYWSEMPDLNWKNPAVEAEFLDIMRFWLARGVDGFRIDAARYVIENGQGQQADQPETHELFQRLRHALHQEYPEALLLAEAWTSVSGVAPFYGEGNGVQLAFAFDVADGIRASVKAGTRNAVETANSLALGALSDRGVEAPFLTNHDQVRVMRELSSGGTPDLGRARLAAALLLAHPGTPFVYYGEALGMVGGAASVTRDEDKRTPMRWTPEPPAFGFTTHSTDWYREAFPTAADAEGTGVDLQSARADGGSLWHLYRRLIALRKAMPALTSGRSTYVSLSGVPSSVFAFLRLPVEGSSDRPVLFVCNLGGTAAAAFSLAVEGTPAVLDAEGLSGAPSRNGAQLSFPGMGPRSFAFVRLD